MPFAISPLTSATNGIFKRVLSDLAALSNGTLSSCNADWNQHRFARFLHNYIQERDLTRQQFVNALATRFDFQPSLMVELVDAILDGVLPDAQLDSQLLAEIGAALDISAATLGQA